MKENLHPRYYNCEVSCSCGAVFHTRSTRQTLKVEICSQCHPFFTGKQKIIDSAGRVEKFNRRYAKFNEAQKKEQQEA
ncbi:MAG TPA: 50S ribosomal protein L31 [Bacteroidota bacterium]|jgi:large subunit ribosomal protein L31|nr:50S ribosomal protein L31 [Bacteroidota bacterium]